MCGCHGNKSVGFFGHFCRFFSVHLITSIVFETTVGPNNTIFYMRDVLAMPFLILPLFASFPILDGSNRCHGNDVHFYKKEPINQFLHVFQ